MFSESLTIRILGDSAHLERELEGVTRRVTDLQSRFAELGDAGRGVSSLGGALATLTVPLRNVGRLVSGVIGQVRVLSRLPVGLNVAPAVASLGGISRMIQLVGAQLTRLNALSGGGDSGSRRPSIRMATGGMVRGPEGIDRVPAMLTAGEFVLRKPAVERLGSAFLEALNRAPSRSKADGVTSLSQAAGRDSSQVNHFGGININVARGGDVHAIVRDLKLHGMRLRNRRG